MLLDSFGRTLNYLRISITDRCNLRCLYCMPPEGVEWKPHENILTFEEIIRVVKIMSALGVCNVKVTGGEPLLRRGMPSFLKQLKNIDGIKRVTLTTNGVLLGAYLDEAEIMGEDALPDGINISLDALDCERYARITRFPRQSLQHAESNSGLNAPMQMILPMIDRLLEKHVNVKINCVPVRTVNEEEILPITSLAKDKNIIVRFIELMPFGSAHAYQPVSGAETAALIEKAFGVLTSINGITDNGITGNGPALYYSLPGFTGKIGFINAVSHGFCETCNRLRLTSEGFLKLCLSNDIGISLREPLRSGVNDEELTRVITNIVKKKPAAHSLSKIYGTAETHPDGLSKIGG